MSVRKHPTKEGFWQIFVRQGRKGKTLVFPIECTEAEAIIYDKQINAQLKGEKLSVYPTLQDSLTQYLEYYGTIASPAIVDDFTSVMRRCLLPVFGRVPAHQIIPTMVYTYTANRLKDKVKNATDRTVSHRTIEKELNYLSAMCRWLYQNGMAEKMPLIPKPPKGKTQPKKMQQPLTIDETNRLLDCVPDDKRVLLLLMCDAGLRMSEALNLEWSNVDLEGRRVTVKGKGGKVVVYPLLTNRLISAISALDDKKTSKWIVVNEKTSLPLQSIKTLLRLAAQRAGITKHVTHHTLRHTFSTILMESGISTEVRRLLMRHSSLSATEHYTHVSPGYMEREARGFSDKINTPCKSVK
jgi:site-specific recombinase XerD